VALWCWTLVVLHPPLDLCYLGAAGGWQNLIRIFMAGKNNFILLATFDGIE